MKTSAWLKSSAKWIKLGIILAFCAFGVSRLGFFDLANAYWLKTCFSIRGIFQPHSSGSSPILLLPITTHSIQKVGKWPWNRKIWGEITKKLEKAKASVIGFDLDFSTPSSSDLKFASTLHKNVILPIWFNYLEKGKTSILSSPVQEVSPAPPFSQKTNQGFVNVETDQFGVHRALLLTHYQGKVYPAFALEAYLLYKKILFKRTAQKGRMLQVGSLKIPLDGEGALWINYNHSHFRSIPADQLLNPNFPYQKIFRHKIVLIGITSPLGQDIKITPVGALPGLDIQAQILDNMLKQQFIYPISPLKKLILLLILGFILGYFLPSYPWKKFLPWVSFLCFGIFISGFLLFALTGAVLNVISLCLLTLLFTGILVLAESRKTETALLNKIQEWQGFNQVSQLHTGDFTLDEFLESALTLTQEIIHDTHAAGILLKNSEGKLVLNIASGVSPNTENQTLNPQEGICGKAASEGKGICIENLQTSSLTAKFEKDLEVSSFLAAPLISKNEIIGVVWAGSLNQTYRQEDLISLSFLGNQIASGIQTCILSQNLSQLYLDAMKALLRAVEFYQPVNKGHSERVASYAIMLGKACSLPAEELETIRSAALLHEIGKMGHFETLYRKPEGLTEEDWKQILIPLKTGLKILQPLSGKFPFLPILYHFYERYDGKGFPDGLKGEEIPIGSRILSLANAFDDISANAPQLGQVHTERAIQEIKKEAGTLFDPALVRLLIQNLSHIPIGEFTKSA